MQPVLDSLASTKIDFVIFDGVEPDPTVRVVEEALGLFKREKCEGLIGIGGGSSIDTAKATGILSTNGGRWIDYEGMDKYTTPPAPVIAIPTTAGTGSEVSGGAVITDPEKNLKITASSEALGRPRVAVLDPQLLRSLPASVAASTGLDALTHALEGYVSLLATPLSEAFAIYAIELIANNLRAFVANRANLEAASRMQAAKLPRNICSFYHPNWQCSLYG